MTHRAPMISSTSQRLLQKTCGLFDEGFAGGTADVTSFDPNASDNSLVDNSWSSNEASLFGNIWSADLPKSTKPVTVTDPEAGHVYSIDDRVSMEENVMDPSKQPNFFMDGWDMLDPLGDLETDQLANDSLDAFINLDSFLMGDTFFDSPAEVKPVIDIDNLVAGMGQVTSATDTPTAANFTSLPVEPARTSKRSHKCKAAAETVSVWSAHTDELVMAAVSEDTVSTTTPLLAGANLELDHDYTTKCQKISSTSGAKSKSSNSKSPSKAKSGKVSSTSTVIQDSSTDLQLPDTADKQTVRRIKNNVASKRSREQRKQKFADMEEEAEQLIVINDELRKKIIELEKIAKEMKAQLVAKMSGK